MGHTHSSLCYTVETFIVHEDAVLLRLHDKYHIWLSVGGHIEQGEDPNQAALREVKEEVGLDVELYGNCLPFGDRSLLVSPKYIDRHRVGETHEHVGLVFFARSKTRELRTPEHEMAECKWFSEEELDDPKYALKPGIKHYAKDALRELRTK